MDYLTTMVTMPCCIFWPLPFQLVWLNRWIRWKQVCKVRLISLQSWLTWFEMECTLVFAGFLLGWWWSTNLLCRQCNNFVSTLHLLISICPCERPPPVITKQENKNPFLLFELLTLSFSILFIIIILLPQILLEIFKRKLMSLMMKNKMNSWSVKFTAKKSMNLRRQWKLNITFSLTLSIFFGWSYFL